MPDIFLHIHKSGGTTLMHLLNRMYENNEVFTIDGRRYKDSMNEFLKLPETERNSFGLIKGHQFYGVHNSLAGDYHYFTFLREPVSRLLSLYNYLREIDLYPEINENNLGLIDFIESGLALAADNGMVRFIAGLDLADYTYGTIDKVGLELALKHIENDFAFAGITEEYDLSLLVLQRTLGWKLMPYYNVANKTKSNVKKSENLNEEEITYITDYLKHDIELYNNIKHSFYNKVLAILGEDFRDQERIFKEGLLKYQSTKPNRYYSLGKRILKKIVK